jgi:hypothetical protein
VRSSNCLECYFPIIHEEFYELACGMDRIMKELISRLPGIVWGGTTLYALWFSRVPEREWILWLPALLWFGLVCTYLGNWSAAKLFVLLIALEGLELGGLGATWRWVNPSHLVTAQTLLLVSHWVAAILACVTRLLRAKRSSDFVLVLVFGSAVILLALTCSIYNTLDQFTSQSMTGWYVYLALVAPFGYTALVGLVLYLVHSFRLLADELGFRQSV